jgi:hypothetical protein
MKRLMLYRKCNYSAGVPPNLGSISFLISTRKSRNAAVKTVTAKITRKFGEGLKRLVPASSF